MFSTEWTSPARSKMVKKFIIAQLRVGSCDCRELWDHHEADLPFTRKSRFPGDWRLIYDSATIVLSARDGSVTEYEA